MAIERYPIDPHIPNEDEVYRRAAKTLFDEDPSFIPPAIFSISKGEDGVSVNWSKYRTAFETRNQEGRKKPEEVNVVFLISGDIRSFSKHGLGVIHKPLPDDDFPEVDNQSHSLITGIPHRDRAMRQAIQQHLSLKSELCKFDPR